MSKTVSYKIDIETDNKLKELFERIKKNPIKYNIYKKPNEFQKKDFYYFMMWLTWNKCNEIDGVTTSDKNNLISIMPDEIIEPDVIKFIYSKEELEFLPSICDRSLMKNIRDIPICGNQILNKGGKPFLYPKGHPNERDFMIAEDIIKHCEQCKQKFTETPRMQELKKAIYETQNKEVTVYTCMNPIAVTIQNLFDSEQSFHCDIYKRIVRIDRTCIKKKCQHLLINTVRLGETSNINYPSEKI